MRPISPSRIREQTGKEPGEWFELLSSRGARDLSHKEIVAILRTEHGISHWWAQQLTVEYEKHIGRRIHGQTQDGLFQLGPRKTMPLSAEGLWTLVRSHPELWFNAGGEAGTETTLVEGSHFRLRWKEADWSDYSILQIHVAQSQPNTAVCSIHQEKLPSLAAREKLIAHWKAVLKELHSLASSA